MEPATIDVVGHGEVSTSPDEATITLGLSQVEPTPQEALAAVAERAERLRALLDELGIPRSDRTTSGLTVGAHQQHDGRMIVDLGYRASNVTTVTVGDPELIGRLVHEAVERCEASIRGPTWRVRRDNPSHLEACRLAMTQARAKAEAYAEAAGGRVDQILQIVEPSGTREPYLGERAARLGDTPVEPGELDVSATVQVRFEFVPGE